MNTITVREYISRFYVKESAEAVISYLYHVRGGLVCGMTLDDTEISYEDSPEGMDDLRNVMDDVIEECRKILEEYIGRDDERTWDRIIDLNIIARIEDKTIRDLVYWNFDRDKYRQNTRSEIIITPEGYMFYQ